MKNLYYASVLVVVIAAAAVAALGFLGFLQEYHAHADFAVFLGREQLDFSQKRFMSDDHHLSERVHLHEDNGSIVHAHAANVTWQEFFSTLGMALSKDCFAADNASYCSNSTHKVRMFANGKEIDDIEGYIIKDLDRVLISFDTGSNIQQQLNKVTDFACVYSNKCPERGSAAGESCISGGKQCE